MRPSFIVVLLIAVVNLCTASVIFLGAPSQPSRLQVAPKSAIEIKWGDG